MNVGKGKPGDRAQDALSWISAIAGQIAYASGSHPRSFLVGGIIVLMASLYSLSHLHISSSMTAMLGTDTKAAAAMDRISHHYDLGDELLVLIELSPDHPESDSGEDALMEYSAQLQTALLENEDASTLIEWVRSGDDPTVDSYFHDVVKPNGAFYLDTDALSELRRRLAPDAIKRQIARNEAMITAAGPAAAALSTRILEDPLRLFEFMPGNTHASRTRFGAGHTQFERSTDLKATLLRVGTSHRGSDYDTAGTLVDDLQRTIDTVSNEEFRIRLGGFAPIAAGTARVIRKDAIVSCVVAIIALLILFRVFYRKWAAGLIITGVAATGLLTGLGAAAMFMDSVSPLAAMIATVLAGLGVDYGIHFLSHYQSRRDAGFDSVEASVMTAQHMASPLIATCGTTVLGFMSLWFSNVQMLSDFAVLGAFGLIGSLCGVLLLMPAAVAMVRWAAPTPEITARTFNLQNWIVRHPLVSISTAGTLLCVLLLGAAMRGFVLPVETDLRVMHPQPNTAMETTAEIIHRFSGQGEFIPIEISAATPEELVIAAHDGALAMTSASCRNAGVIQITGLHQLLPDPRQSEQSRRFFAEVDSNVTMKAFWDSISGSVFSEEAYAEYGEMLNELITPHDSPSLRDLLRHEELSQRILPTNGLVDQEFPTQTVLVAQLSEPLVDRSQRAHVINVMNDAASTIMNADVTVSGVAAVALELEVAARRGLPRSGAISLTLVLLWLFLFLRSISRVLKALLPLAFAATVTILFIIATGQELNPINAVALPLLAGLAVDAGVFLLAASPTRGDQPESMRGQLQASSHAVILSILTTSLAFLAICVSHTPAIRSLGIVSAIGVMAAGVGALCLLLPLLTYGVVRSRN